MILLIGIQIAVFTAYIAFITARFGILPSISDSYYCLSEKYRKQIFMSFILGVALPMFFYGTLWFALASSFLCFVGVAAAYKDKITGTVHNVGVYGGIIFALVGLIAQGHPPFAAAIILIAYLITENISNKTWWREIVAFIAIIAEVLVLYFPR